MAWLRGTAGGRLVESGQGVEGETGAARTRFTSGLEERRVWRRTTDMQSFAPWLRPTLLGPLGTSRTRDLIGLLDAARHAAATRPALAEAAR